MNPMEESQLLDEVFRALDGEEARERRATGVARAIRQAGTYRWVGLYEVTEDEIVNLAFDGLGVPAHPRFPVTQGLSGAAVASGETVMVGDVTQDPRYLTAFGSTRSEIIVPMLNEEKKVVGMINADSDKLNAFDGEDRQFLERAAGLIAHCLS